MIKGNEPLVKIDNVSFTLDELFMVAKGLIVEKDRFEAMPEKSMLYLSLVAAKDYMGGIKGAESVKYFKYDVVDDLEERAFLMAIVCLYCELRYRAVRGYNMELAKSYLDYRNTLLNRAFRTMKKNERIIFFEVLIA